MNRKSLAVILMLWTAYSVEAADFTGKWAVSAVDYPDDYYEEIKYPHYFELSRVDEGLVGFYQDQFGYQCRFPVAVMVNGGEELLLMVCGTTKSVDSWAPLHKVKLIDGELVANVITFDHRFTWHARRVEDIPMTPIDGTD